MQSFGRNVAAMGTVWRELARDHVCFIASAPLLQNKLQKSKIQHGQMFSFNTKMSTVAATTSAEKTHRNSLSYFEDLLPSLVEDVTKSSGHADAPDIMTWVEKVLKYNCSGGKKNRGMSTVMAYEMLESPDNVTSESLRLAAIMGWCVEFLQSYLLILDDVMDGSQYRRGALCWYRQPHVGLSAINDALLVQGSLNTLLRKYFRTAPYYADILDTFNQVLFQTSMGQYLDCSTAGRGERADISKFTMERYSAIIKYKTAYYTYLLPVKLAMYMAGKRSSQAHEQVEQICLKIGHFFQIQDDYLDCFGERFEIGKDGTDIKEGKCCWPVVAALERCTPEQRAIVDTYYGSKEPAHEQIIKELYRELGVQQIYLAQEREGYEQIRADVDKLMPEISRELFVRLLDKIYKRRS